MARARRMLAFVFALSLLFSGCGRKPKEPSSPLPAHSGNYSTTANIVCRDMEAQAVISQQTPQSCSVTFSAPRSLEDLSFIFWGDRIDVGYKGLGFTFRPDSIPGSAVAQVTVSAINHSMKDDGLAVSLEDNALILSGFMESGAFTLQLDKETGNLMKLSVPSEELEIEFLNFTFLD